MISKAPCTPNDTKRAELNHLKSGIQDRINETVYWDRVPTMPPTMVKRRGDLEKQLLNLDTEAIHEEQAFWNDIALLAKELRYKLERSGEEKSLLSRALY